MKPDKLILYSSLFMLLACEKEEPLLTIDTDAPPAVITTTSADLNTSVTEEKLTDEMMISWSKTNYGVSTEVSYTVEVDLACNNFANPVALGSTTGTSLPVTIESLNSKSLNDLHLAQHVPSQLSVRVTSKIKNQFVRSSEPVTFTIAPWNAREKSLWLISDGWEDHEAPAIYNDTESGYEGYLSLSDENTFAFADKRTCDKTMFGGSAGELSISSAEELVVEESGYFRVKVNTQNLTYELTRIESFGVVGSATPGSWDNSTAMTYDESRQVWEVTVDLMGGALKFRANNSWTINYGPASSNELSGTLRFDDPGAISIAEPGNYTVTLDLSQTKTSGYTYTVMKNSDEVAPAKLWVPGEYQGWSPGTAPTIKALNADVFEGYVNITSPTGYKFTSAPDWDHINYGDAGDNNLTTDGLANGMGLSTAGVYKFNVNVTTLKYSAVLINSIGMVGPATAGGSDTGWGTSVPMTYDATNNVWTATIDLAPGALKFRANNEWTINYGPSDVNSLEGVLLFDDPDAINITAAGNYTVTVDFSRAQAPYKYTYSVVKN
jgi:starch-binding outer membrane protein SusE/F